MINESEYYAFKKLMTEGRFNTSYDPDTDWQQKPNFSADEIFALNDLVPFDKDKPTITLGEITAGDWTPYDQIEEQVNKMFSPEERKAFWQEYHMAKDPMMYLSTFFNIKYNEPKITRAMSNDFNRAKEQHRESQANKNYHR